MSGPTRSSSRWTIRARPGPPPSAAPKTLPPHGGIFCAYSCSLSTGDRKSTRVNSSHSQISYGGFCVEKKITGGFHPCLGLADRRLGGCAGRIRGQIFGKRG